MKILDKMTIGDMGAIISMIGSASLMLSLVSGIFWHPVPLLSLLGIITLFIGFVLINIEQSDKIKYLSPNYREKGEENWRTQ